ncbi:Rossmann-like and DUF2520 domain-containing protein [Clostridium sp. MD294]|uniref:Rossmann-like and DUF2520 domain-containing protein n=1 Tax=Clostridium sp. MD294 TaxID=97138 RepID=UPI0002CC380E|nr:Rossmann-like and DUF2520 domain-containing protein [Clostridium sp. MD294]NDO46150.1 DUF2520 domain-containing protein [Clostridium sp. MD294]USF30184.1 hypothetical protein C820_001625 [Clostridium sp. MD294]
MNIGLIGAGKVGCTLGKFFVQRKYTVAGYYSRSRTSAEEAARFTQTKVFDTIEEIVNVCDVLFLTVPDGSLTQVFEQIANMPIDGKYICHCSGTLSASEAFTGIEKTGAFGYSVHPLFAISDKFHAYEELTDIFFALEGHPAHLEEIKSLFHGCRIKTIPSDCKTAYHASAVIASNLVIALLNTAFDLMQQCGFTQQQARSALSPLIEGNIKHILQKGAEQSLTGPIERGDSSTIVKHLNCLSQKQKEIYIPLSRALIEIAEKKHTNSDYSNIRDILKGEQQ